MKQLNYIELSGKKLPIRCSNYVLEQIQNKYKSLSKFEELLFGKEKIKGKEDYKKVEVNVGAMNDFLVWCVKEGLELEAILKNKPAEEYTDKQIILMVDVPPFALQVELCKEFIQAFEIKK